MLILLALHGVIGLSAPVVWRWLGRRVFLWCAIAPAATVVWAATKAREVLDGDAVTESLRWVPELGLELSFRLDAFSLLMVALVSGIGVLVFLYASPYFAGHERRGLGAFATHLTLFSGAMLGLVIADDLIAIYVFWELTTVTSYALIGFEDERSESRAAARQALLITVAGGLAMLAGFVLLGQAAGTTSLSAILADPPSGGVVSAALVLILLGAFTKSAQVPFHSWLPGAMAAPTPVSAYLHSATMVKAGVYLVARLAPVFAVVAVWRPLVIPVGLATMLIGGARALRQHDLKLLLAYGTISQLGFLMVLLGMGHPEATSAGIVLLVAHALFKAALFLVVGVIDHQVHTRDIRELSGVGRQLPFTFAVAAVAAVSMAGLPPLFGFLAKEHAYEAFLHGGQVSDSFILAVVVAGSVITFAYSARFLWGAFASKRGAAESAVPSVAPAFIGAPALLAALTVGFGFVPPTRLMNTAAQALDPLAHAATFAIIPHLNAALALSAITIALGIAIVVARRSVESFQARGARLPSAQGAYEAALTGLNVTADRVTGTVQHGSLPTYLATIVATAVLLPGVVLLRGLVWPAEATFAESPLQAAVVLLVAAAAIGAAVTLRRLAAVLLLGAVGYGVAVLFVIQGAPDLALTQLLIETLAVVIFVLVLRQLPDRFHRPHGRALGIGRLLVSTATGILAFGFSLAAAGVRVADPVSDVFLDRSLPDAGGRNVVNVILVDFRGFDTLGEITVLVVAALGISSLMLAGTRSRRRDDQDTTEPDATEEAAT